MGRIEEIPALDAGEVHAWRFSLGADGPADYERLANADDLRRSRRFAFARDRARFLTARHVMRDLLGCYLDVEPRELAILYSPHGKPGLEARFGIGFNLTHSGDHGLIAFTRAPEIGVDIEEMCHREDRRSLASSVFCASELEALGKIDDAALDGPFLTCWTRKEALLKALGVGLSIDPREVDVGIEPVRSRHPIPGRDTVVEVASLFRDDQCVAALAVAGGYTSVRMLAWTP